MDCVPAPSGASVDDRHHTRAVLLCLALPAGHDWIAGRALHIVHSAPVLGTLLERNGQAHVAASLHPDHCRIHQRRKPFVLRQDRATIPQNNRVVCALLHMQAAEYAPAHASTPASSSIAMGPCCWRISATCTCAQALPCWYAHASSLPTRQDSPRSAPFSITLMLVCCGLAHVA